MITPVFYIGRYYKRLLTQISYDNATKQFVFNGWGRNNVIRTSPQIITPVWTKNMRVKSIDINKSP